MTKTTIDRQKDGTISLTVNIPFKTVEKTREEIVENVSKQVNIPGFRKGKAPQKLAEGKIDHEQVTQEVLKKLLPQAYTAAVKEYNLRPIMNPKIHIEKIEEGQDWQFTALTCEMPEINLGTYKQEVKNVTAKNKIVIPGKEQQKPNMDEVINAMLAGVNIKVPSVLIEQETDRLLSQLLDDIKKLGLSLDQYLATTKRTAEDLRSEYMNRADRDIKLEFVLQKIAETERIVVENQEIEEAIAKAKDPAEKQNLETNRYLLAGILKQQKTLDFLLTL